MALNPRFARPAAGASRQLLAPADAAALIALAGGGPARAAASPATVRGPGTQASVFAGRGLDYAESRAYQSGDDLRDLHWQLYARTGRPHTKLHREEHATAWHLLLDLRPHMAFGTRQRTKAEQAARAGLLAAAMQALAREGAPDDMALTVWQGDGPHAVDLGRGAAALRRLSRHLAALTVAPPSATARTDADAPAFAAWARRLARTLPDGAEVILATDAARWDGPEADAALWTLRAKAQVRLLWVRDSAESALPAAVATAGLTFADIAATRRTLIGADDIARFAERASARAESRLAHWRGQGIAGVAVSTAQPDTDLLRALRAA